MPRPSSSRAAALGINKSKNHTLSDSTWLIVVMCVPSGNYSWMIFSSPFSPSFHCVFDRPFHIVIFNIPFMRTRFILGGLEGEDDPFLLNVTL